MGRKRGWTALAAAAAVLTVAACTDDPVPPVPVPSGSAAPAVTYEEAVAKVPMDGTETLAIRWDVSKVPDTDVVLAARRAVAFDYWKSSSSDWSQVIPVGQPLSTETLWRELMAPFAGSTDSGADSNGIVWIKTLGVEEIRPYQVRVNFCADIGYLRREADSPEFRADRARLQAQEMQYVKTADGTSRWLTRGQIDEVRDRDATYGAECTKWAAHKR